ncbi:hypothetical protein [Variovorax sp. PvP013]|uniref:hypothetical protein n=1 Tax=Variovorax sp. PvP013 TaxID=3156435 RepID=UPI003D2637A5
MALPSDVVASIQNNFYRDGGMADPILPMSTSGPWKSVAEFSAPQANAMAVNKLPAGVLVTQTYSADALNQLIVQANPNYKPSYMPGTQILEFTTTTETKFVRVSGGQSQATANWVMKAEDIAGLSPAQIAAKFALPAVPMNVGDVTIPPGIKLQASVANGILLGNNPGGGGVQFYIPMEQRSLPKEWFDLVRPINVN